MSADGMTGRAAAIESLQRWEAAVDDAREAGVVLRSVLSLWKMLDDATLSTEEEDRRRDAINIASADVDSACERWVAARTALASIERLREKEAAK